MCHLPKIMHYIVVAHSKMVLLKRMMVTDLWRLSYMQPDKISKYIVSVKVIVNTIRKLETKYTLILRIRKVQILKQQEFCSIEGCWVKLELHILAMSKF